MDLLFRLPEYCCYVEMPEGFDSPETHRGLRGFFVHLEYDLNARHAELRFLLDFEDAEGGLLKPVILNLTGGTLEDCLNSVLDEEERNFAEMVERMTETAPELAEALSELFSEDPDAEDSPRERTHKAEAVRPLAAAARPLLAMTLYLCAANADIAAADGSGKRPANPSPRRTKKHGEKVFAAQEVGVWDVGHRVGATLRRVEAAERGVDPSGSGNRFRPRPHVRRAHFRNQPVGPRREGRRELRWIHLAFVNLLPGDDLPTVTRPVDAAEDRPNHRHAEGDGGQRFDAGADARAGQTVEKENAKGSEG